MKKRGEETVRSGYGMVRGLVSLLVGKGAALLGAGGDAAGVFLVLFAINPLKQDIYQEITAKNAKREEQSNWHRDLGRTSVKRRSRQG
jgi:hypothetical protein